MVVRRTLGLVKTAIRAVARWARSHLAAWIVGATAVNGALATLLAVLIALPDQSHRTVGTLIVVLILVLVLSVIFPVAGRVVDKRNEKAERERERQEQAAAQAQARLEHMDRLLALGSSAGLPRLSEVTNDLLGVTPTRYSIEGNDPYVARPAADRAIRDLLRQPGPPYPFVIVWGTTKTGKSRTLAEALRATFDEDPVVVRPLDSQALPELARLGIDRLVDHRPAVVLLDDLDPAGLEALTAEVLNLVRGWAVIAATMTAQRRAEVLTASGVGTLARASLAAVSGEYEMTAEAPSGNEKDEAERLYPGESFDGSIAETLVGARELIARYKASFDTNPAGCALLRAAIDFRRAGITRPVAEMELRRLFPLYLPVIRAGLLPTAEQFTNAIHWATQPVASQVALLRPVSPVSGPPAWTVFDHAMTSDDAHGSQGRPIPADIWSELIDIIPTRDTFAVGLSAFVRHEISAAITAFRKATTSDQADIASAGALTLGALLQERGDTEEASTAYQFAVDSGHADLAPIAAFQLGNLLKDRGDFGGAQVAYQHAIDSGHADQAPKAALSLGNLLNEQGDIEGAKIAYQHAIDSGHADMTPRAAFQLGNLLKDQGDVEGARAAYQRAIDSGNADIPAAAGFQLGQLLHDHGDVEGARAAYQRAIDSGHAGLAAAAMLQLGNLLRDQGDVEGARAAYQRAIDSGHAGAVARAMFQLGNLLNDQGDVDGARYAYQRLIDSGDADVAPVAALKLGELLYGQGDTERTRKAFRRAIDSGHADVAPRAALALGLLLYELGDAEEARQALQRAIDSGHADVAPRATLQLGVRLQGGGLLKGNVEVAKEYYRRAMVHHPAPGDDLHLNLLVLLVVGAADCRAEAKRRGRASTRVDIIGVPALWRRRQHGLQGIRLRLAQQIGRGLQRRDRHRKIVLPVRLQRLIDLIGHVVGTRRRRVRAGQQHQQQHAVRQSHRTLPVGVRRGAVAAARKRPATFVPYRPGRNRRRIPRLGHGGPPCQPTTTC